MIVPEDSITMSRWRKSPHSYYFSLLFKQMVFSQPAKGITHVINKFESKIFWEVGSHIEIKKK